MAHHHRAHRRDHDRGARGLNGSRVHEGPVDAVEVASEGRHLVAQQPIHDLEVLAEPRDALRRLPVRDADHVARRVDRDPRPEAHLDATVRDVIERESLPREHGRVPERDLCDAAREPDRPRRGRQPRERGPGFEPGTGRMGVVDERVGQPRDLDPELLEPDEARPEDVPGDVGHAEDVEPQRRTHAPFSHGAPGRSRGRVHPDATGARQVTSGQGVVSRGGWRARSAATAASSRRPSEATKVAVM